jgi:hypothetical protein
VAEDRNAIKAEALREAAFDFQRAARAGLEPTLNSLASSLLFARAERVERGEPAGQWPVETRALAPSREETNE